MLAAASQPPLPTFATEFALDYHVRNLQYGFIALGRWTVDHKNSTGGLNLRERTDSYNKTLQPRAEVKDYNIHADFRWFDAPSAPPCVQEPLNGTQPAWTIGSGAKLIDVPGVSGAEVWRVLHASIGECVDYYVRGAWPGTRDSLPYQLLFFANCSSASGRTDGEVLAQNNSYSNFSLADNPASLFRPAAGQPCPPVPASAQLPQGLVGGLWGYGASRRDVNGARSLV